MNLTDAIRGTIEHDESGKQYELDDDPAVLLVRPRGWHLPERHVQVDGEPVAGGLLDFALYVHHNAEALLERGAGPYFYLPKLESHLEARLWNDAFVIAEEALGLDRGHDQGHRPDRDAARGVRDGRDPLRAARPLRRAQRRPLGLHLQRDQALPRRGRSSCCPTASEVTMTVPFMRAYTELLVKTCHRRGAHAMGGMAAVIPTRTDEEADRARLRGGARRQGARGRRRLRRHLGRSPRLGRPWPSTRSTRCSATGPTRSTSSATTSPSAPPTCSPSPPRRARSPRQGLRSNVNVGIQYISSWLRGNGAAGDLRPDGGRRHGRDLPRPGVAVDPPRREARRRPHGHARAGPRAGGRGAGEDPRRRSATTSGSSARAGPSCRASCSSRWR